MTIWKLGNFGRVVTEALQSDRLFNLVLPMESGPTDLRPAASAFIAASKERIARLGGVGDSGPKLKSAHDLASMVVVLVAGVTLATSSNARTDLLVRSPIADFRETEYEHNGSISFDSKRELDKDQSSTHAIGLGVTPFWKIELEGETAALRRQSGLHGHDHPELFSARRILGDLFEYSRFQRGSTDGVKFGPTIQKETAGFGRYGLLHTFFLKRTLVRSAEPEPASRRPGKVGCYSIDSFSRDLRFTTTSMTLAGPGSSTISSIMWVRCSWQLQPGSLRENQI